VSEAAGLAFYAEMVEVAAELLLEFGRDATLERAARLTATDPAKPWRAVQGPAAAAPAQSFTVRAVITSDTREAREGTTLKANERVMFLQSATALPEIADDEWEVVDADGTRLGVRTMTPIQPGQVLILYRAVVTV